MKRNIENIIITKSGEMALARNEAKRVSTSRTHSWCSVYYIDSEYKKLTCETFADGKFFNINREQLRFPGDVWFSTGRTRGLSILNAMVRYAESDFICANARRLGGAGKYSRY